LQKKNEIELKNNEDVEILEKRRREDLKSEIKDVKTFEL